MWYKIFEYHKMAVKNLMGAMRQKIAIFKEENSVWWGPKFSNITKWHYFLDADFIYTKNMSDL